MARKQYAQHILDTRTKHNAKQAKSSFLKQNPDIKQKWDRKEDLEGMKAKEQLFYATCLENAKKNLNVDTWIPNFWLTFLLIGMGGPVDNERSSLIVSGRFRDIAIEGPSLLRELGAKKVRRSEGIAFSDSDTTAENRPGKKNKGFVVVHEQGPH